jgi:SAM-dependent methyltransferase
LNSHWFEPLADHLGSAYLRYSFTRGTDQEVAFLIDALELTPGTRLLDIGCGPGRHAEAFATRGVDVVGIDISQRFVDIATERVPSATFTRMDARQLTFDGEFDAAISLCQGAFGLVGPGDDIDVLRGIARALRRGGRCAVSAFSSYFQVRYPQEHGAFDAATGIHHERTTLKSEDGVDLEADLWTTCYTARELALLFGEAGLDVEHIWSVEPGRYRREQPTVESPELLVVAFRAAQIGR